jgi:MFS superfamily sulfate permease-like transporter
VFRAQLQRLAGTDPPPRWILLAAEPITDIDSTAADMLAGLDEALNARGISLVLAEVKTPLRTKIDRYRLTGGVIDPAHFFPTMGSAVEAYQRLTGAEWAVTAKRDEGLPPGSLVPPR